MLLLANHKGYFAYPVTIVSSGTIDNSLRHVKLNHAGDNIMYVSRNMPQESKPVPCPYYVNKSLTLGENNLCWI